MYQLAWFAVVLEGGVSVTGKTGDMARSFNSNTFGLNAIGTEFSSKQYFNSPFFGANFTNSNNEGMFQIFSSEVVDLRISGPSTLVPELSSALLLGPGLLALGWRCGDGGLASRMNESYVSQYSCHCYYW